MLGIHHGRISASGTIQTIDGAGSRDCGGVIRKHVIELVIAYLSCSSDQVEIGRFSQGVGVFMG